MASIDDLLDFINSEDPVYKIQDEDLNVKKIKDEHEKNDEDLKLCIICMVNIKNTILIPCGHKCLCDTCCTLFIYKSLSLCPLCKADIIKFKIEKIEENIENKICHICNKFQRTCFMIPCGHRCTCSYCGDSILNSTKRCPECYELVLHVLKNVFE